MYCRSTTHALLAALSAGEDRASAATAVAVARRLVPMHYQLDVQMTARPRRSATTVIGCNVLVPE